MMVPMEPMTAAPSNSDLISSGDQNQDNLIDIGTPNIIESIVMSGTGNNPHPKGGLVLAEMDVFHTYSDHFLISEKYNISDSFCK